MAVITSAAAKQASTDAVTDLLDAETPPGNLVLKAGSTTVVTLPLSKPSFTPAVPSGEATANPITATNAVADGTADGFELQDGAGLIILSGTVTITGGGGDIELTNVDILTGQLISINTLTYNSEP